VIYSVDYSVDYSVGGLLGGLLGQPRRRGSVQKSLMNTAINIGLVARQLIIIKQFN